MTMNKETSLIKADGDTRKVHPKDNNSFSLEELQSYVGGYIEFIYLGDMIMVIDEEGTHILCF